jgi:hypothetical protein
MRASQFALVAIVLAKTGLVFPVRGVASASLSSRELRGISSMLGRTASRPRLLLYLLLWLLWAGPAHAGATYVFEDHANKLHSLDVSTGALTEIATLSFRYGAMTVGQDRQIYAVQWNTAHLYRIDPDDGVETFVGNMNVGCSSIAFDADNQLWCILFSALYRIDHTNAEWTYVTSTSSVTKAGLAWDGSKIYTVLSTSLREVDTTTGGLPIVGPLVNVSMGFDSDLTSNSLGQLSGVNDVSGQTEYFTFNNATGEATIVHTLIDEIVAIATDEWFDTDLDGMPDYWEDQWGFDKNNAADGALDFDSDGLTNVQDYDAKADPTVSDTDGDGLSDFDEVNVHGTLAHKADSDSDGASDGDEINTHLTDPLDPDTDDDGMTDGFEVTGGLNPFVDDSSGDLDMDGIDNITEFNLGTLPNNSDSDGDGLGDHPEVNIHLTDPADADSDDDGASDGDEVNTHLTDPLDEDTEDDGMLDGWEIDHGLDPLVDDTAGDADSDTWTNFEEHQWQTAASNALDKPSVREAYAIYRHTADPAFYKINLIDTTATKIRDLDDSFSGLAFGQDRKLYTVNFNLDELHTIDPKTGRTTKVGDLGMNAANGGLAFDESGQLWMTSGVTVNTVDHTTGAATQVGISGTGNIHGIAWDGSELYGLNDLRNALHVIDRTTGESTEIGELDFGISQTGLASDDRGVLFGVDFGGPGITRIFRLDKATGASPLLSENVTPLFGAIAVENAFVDTDRDGMPDYWESQYGFNPNDIADGVLDQDSDGLSNADEYTWRTDPTTTDFDADGLTDGAEVHTHSTDPTEVDSDGDELSDGDEVNLSLTDPTDPDTDDDEMYDGYEYTYGLDPFVDDASNDPDADTYDNHAESFRKTDPLDGTETPFVRDGYLLSTSENLYSIDLATGVRTFIGSTSLSHWTVGGLAMRSDGFLYSTVHSPAGLFRLDPATAATNTIGAFTTATEAALGGLAFDGNDVLWAVIDSTLYTIDPTTGVETVVGLSGVTTTTDIAWDGARLVAYSRTTHGVFEVDRTTGELSWLSDVDEPDLQDISGFAADGRGVFYATTHREYYGFEPTTGVGRYRLDYSPCCFPEMAVQSLGDQDSDGLADINESAIGTDLFTADTDTDGVNDGNEVANGTDPLDSDSDDDGLTDGQEVTHATDPLDADSDDDGVLDGAEILNGTDPLDADSDDDGLDDGGEASAGTDPLDADSDDDGLSDGDEVNTHGTDPLDDDSDDDNVLDAAEVANGTDPLDADSDDDGLDDGAEATAGTDPLDADSDDDAVLDGAEITNGTDPLDADSDDDGLDDGQEILAGTDPLDLDTDDDLLTDGDEIANGTDPLDADTDDDGLDDFDERTYGTDPHVVDSDGDGYSDGDEVHIHGTAPNNSIDYPGAPEVPALGPAAFGMLIALLGGLGVRSARRRGDSQ